MIWIPKQSTLTNCFWRNYNKYSQVQPIFIETIVKTVTNVSSMITPAYFFCTCSWRHIPIPVCCCHFLLRITQYDEQDLEDDIYFIQVPNTGFFKKTKNKYRYTVGTRQRLKSTKQINGKPSSLQIINYYATNGIHNRK